MSQKICPIISLPQDLFYCVLDECNAWVPACPYRKDSVACDSCDYDDIRKCNGYCLLIDNSPLKPIIELDDEDI